MRYNQTSTLYVEGWSITIYICVCVYLAAKELTPPRGGGRFRIWRDARKGPFWPYTGPQKTNKAYHMACLYAHISVTLTACSVCLNVLWWHQPFDFSTSWRQAPRCFDWREERHCGCRPENGYHLGMAFFIRFFVDSRLTCKRKIC